MSTTVIASTLHGRLLWLPVSAPALDVDAVRAVLNRHGVRWVGDRTTQRANEFIVAQDLPAHQAGALAEDLRAIGLSVRVVNRTGLTGSRRVGNALTVQMLLGMLGVAGMALGLDSVGPHPVLVLPALLMLFAVINGIALGSRNGARLALAGSTESAPEDDVADEVARRVTGLPDALARSLVERARSLQVQVAANPDGPAANELRALLDELRTQDSERLVMEARKLREDVSRATRAMAETDTTKR